jgi:uncharacterized LabA/DUF88 family protein
MSPFGIRDDQRVAVFIDGPSLYLATLNSNWEMDYRLLRTHFNNNADLYRMFYFTTLPPEVKENEEEPYSPVIKLVDWLEYNGYEVNTKPTRYTYDPEGRRRLFRDDMHVEIAIDMLETVPFADHFILFAGDSDLKYAIKAVKRRGARVTVVCPKASATDDLRRAADRHIDIGDPVVRDLLANKRPPTTDRTPRRETVAAGGVVDPVARNTPVVMSRTGAR